MNMAGDHMGGDYQTDNTVTGFSQNHLLAWATAPAARSRPGGSGSGSSRSQGSDETLVRLTYDWSKVDGQGPAREGVLPPGDRAAARGEPRQPRPGRHSSVTSTR